MELRDLAHRVLFATTLEEKLHCPDAITDHHPGLPLNAPAEPGRPADLRFARASSGKSSFPSLHRLDQESERGRLLHFFANHELLATELMALVLLRFPEAPAPFRRGVLQTLRDEQAHTRLYLRRMEECGVAFGELPVSGYFWRAISGMSDPLDYVTGLSLTFEQANLDFCRQFARAFTTVGDEATAQLFNSIYRDEIAHVALGLKWFRRWKDPAESDWEAFRHRLRFPLSPQRAKGPELNVQGREEAGLDPSFISELAVYSQSKGRTPNVYVFNPFAEGWIARGPGFTPTKHQARLAADLANLPQFLCRQDDVVLVPRRPSVEFLANLQRAGLPIPEFFGTGSPFPPGRTAKGSSKPSGETSWLASLAGRKLGRLRPWAWAPDSIRLLAPLVPAVTGESVPLEDRYNREIALLYSKAWSAGFLNKLLAKAPCEAWLCRRAEVGIAVESFPRALEVIREFRAQGYARLVAKEAIGLAGHNALRLWESEITKPQERWLERTLAPGNQIVIEPWCERLLDFSIQLQMEPGGLRVLGYTGLINDLKGQFRANWAAPNYARRLPPGVTAAFTDSGDLTVRLREFYAVVFQELEAALQSMKYQGPLGIDVFVYRASTGEARLKPVVEINPRYTMGRVTLELMRHVCPGKFGLFRLWTDRDRGGMSIVEYARLLEQRHPVSRVGSPVGRLSEGIVCLNDAGTAGVCLATFRVEPTLCRLLSEELVDM